MSYIPDGQPGAAGEGGAGSETGGGPGESSAGGAAGTGAGGAAGTGAGGAAGTGAGGAAGTGAGGGTGHSEAMRRYRRLRAAVKESMRELSVQLSLLNAQVGGHLELRETDVDCLDVITRHEPIGPGALARRTGLHPATMTGVLDRLERGRWISRERDPADRRAVLIRANRERGGEIFQLYLGMNKALDEICGRYQEAELAVLADFLRRTVDAGHAATVALAAG